MKKILFLFILIIIICGSFLFWVSQQYTVPILAYHSFGDIEWTPIVTPENFNRQLEYIKKKGYDVITLDELVEVIKSKRSFKKNKVVITIDDGYSDNFKYAYPALKRFGFPATIFIIGGFIGEDPDYLTWDEVKIMANDGISFGSHTTNHLCLENVLDDEVLEEEIAG
ncbi:MAG: polysaccharide deacetylase family protein, partial [Candidatus Omnitrophota bacterium]